MISLSALGLAVMILLRGCVTLEDMKEASNGLTLLANLIILVLAQVRVGSKCLSWATTDLLVSQDNRVEMVISA